MNEILTFSQCLTQVMQKHHLSLNSLATMIGSRADLRHVLSGDSTVNKQTAVYEKLKKSNLFDDEDYRQLFLSLEISRIGTDRYRFQQAISAIISGSVYDSNEEIILDSGKTLNERLALLENAQRIEIMCINSCFHSLFRSLANLFTDSKRNLTLQHYVHSSTPWNTAAEYVEVVMPVLFDDRYMPYLVGASPALCISGNVLAIKAEIENEPVEMVFAISGPATAFEIPNPALCHMYAFLSKIIRSGNPEPMPIKEQSPHKLDFPSLCMTFLSHELNRPTYSIINDLSFQQIPTDIAAAAFLDKGISSDEETKKILSRTISIHEQRYKNQYHKKKMNYHIMTISGIQRFLNTGMSTDHFIGFRAFTVEERKIIFAEMLKAAEQNRCFIPLLLKNEDFRHQYNLVCYDKLGVSIDAKDTNYDISNGYRSVLLMLPEFTKQYQEYYLDMLVTEKCYSRDESLRMLKTAFDEFVLEFPT